MCFLKKTYFWGVGFNYINLGQYTYITKEKWILKQTTNNCCIWSSSCKSFA